ncbi:hypothetical protein FRX31_025106, partial [Thalictrum thalictroides]
MQLVLWPHEQRNISTPTPKTMEIGQQSSNLQANRPGLHWINFAGLEQLDFFSTQQVDFQRFKTQDPTITHLQSPTGVHQSNNFHDLDLGNNTNRVPTFNNTTLLNSFLPQSDPLPPENLGQFNQPLIIHEPSPDNQPPRCRRGRPIGSINKPKLPIDRKGKQKIQPGDNEEVSTKIKKRKVVPTDSSSSTTPYIPQPPPLFTPIANHHLNQHIDTNHDNLDLLSQMYANPTLTNLLIQQGALNPRILNRLVAHVTQPIITHPPLNPSSPNSTLQGPYHNHFEATLNEHNTDASSNTLNLNLYTTQSPTGGLEYNTRAGLEQQLGGFASRETEINPLQSSSVSENHNQLPNVHSVINSYHTLITHTYIIASLFYNCSPYYNLFLQFYPRTLCSFCVAWTSDNYWFCTRGCGGNNTKRTLVNLIYDHKPDIVFISETKSSSNTINDLIYASKFENHFSVPPIHQAGGLLLLWSNRVQLSISHSNKYIITAKVQLENDKQNLFTLSCFYGSPYTTLKEHSWESLFHACSTSNLPWIVIRDLNVSLNQCEKLGGLPFNPQTVRFAADMIYDLGLIDLG